MEGEGTAYGFTLRGLFHIALCICVIGNAMHAVRSFECRPILRPYFWPFLTSFWFHTRVFLASYAFGMWHI